MIAPTLSIVVPVYFDLRVRETVSSLREFLNKRNIAHEFIVVGLVSSNASFPVFVFWLNNRSIVSMLQNSRFS